MKLETKDKIKAGIGTLLFHSLLILALFFMALKTPLPLPDEEGVEVNLGYSDVGQATQSNQPENNKTALASAPENTVRPNMEEVKDLADEEIVKQESEDAPAIVDKPEPKKEPEKKQEKPTEKPEINPNKETDKTKESPKEQVKTAEPEPKPVVDPRLLYTGKKTNNSVGDDQSIGNKGLETGVPNAANFSGVGGLGTDGISYNLGNRKASSLPKPSYDSNDQGRVNVRIRVNKEGQVIGAEVLQKGTTVTDIKLQNFAVQAALKAVFSPDSNAAEIQVGTITYNFIKIN